jgi:hypothetical protein
MDEIRVTGSEGRYEIECAFDLTALDHPQLGPYTDESSALRAGEEIADAVAGTSS